jgi:hypothetical protein
MSPNERPIQLSKARMNSDMDSPEALIKEAEPPKPMVLKAIKQLKIASGTKKGASLFASL